MSYKYVSKNGEDICFNDDGVSAVRLSIDDDFKDLDEYGIEWYRVNLKSGATYAPKLESNKIVFLMFNGKSAYINYADEIFRLGLGPLQPFPQAPAVLQQLQPGKPVFPELQARGNQVLGPADRHAARPSDDGRRPRDRLRHA